MVTLSRVIRASADELFAVLSNYANYRDWTPDVVESAMLATEGDIAVVEFRSPLLSDEKCVIEFVQSKPSSIVYRQVDQYGTRGLRGSWHLAPAGNRSNETTVTGTMAFRAGAWWTRANGRRAGLILRRRLDALEQLFGGQ